MSDAYLNDSFQPYLHSGERIVWTGRPQQGVRFTGRDVFLVPFSLVWSAFALSAFGSAFVTHPQSQPPFPFDLILPLFLAVGVYAVFGRFLVDAWARSRMIYALTDRRALIIRRLFNERLVAVSLFNCPSLRLTLSGARGDVDFAASKDLSSVFFSRNLAGGWSIWTPSLDDAPRFLGVEDAQRVYELAQRPARS